MQKLNHSIIGSGLSALVTDNSKPNSTIFTNNNNLISKSKRFYEYQKIGGNSNIWGGYINYKRYKKYLKNDNFREYMGNNNIFEAKKFIYIKKFSNTYYLSEKNTNKVFRVKKHNFRSNIIINKINKIVPEDNYILLESNNNTFKTSNLSICIGNLGLLELLYNSNLLKKSDKISFLDGNVSYCLNLYLNNKKNYYIPMTLNEISKKILFGRLIERKDIIKNVFIVQNFSSFAKKYSYNIEEILKFKSKFLRYFLSNHIAGLKVNDVPIINYVRKISDKIKINCSGINKNYISGPISQDLIFNALN